MASPKRLKMWRTQRTSSEGERDLSRLLCHQKDHLRRNRRSTRMVNQLFPLPLFSPPKISSSATKSSPPSSNALLLLLRRQPLRSRSLRDCHSTMHRGSSHSQKITRRNLGKVWPSRSKSFLSLRLSMSLSSDYSLTHLLKQYLHSLCVIIISTIRLVSRG